MAVNTIGDFIRGVFPSGVNRNGTLFRSLLADKDTNTGTVEKVFSEVESERKNWCRRTDIWEQSGEQLHKTLDLISILKQSDYESDESYRNRNKYIFERMGSVIHGTPEDIKRIFEDLLKNECFIVNNSMEYAESLLVNGNCEQDTGWILSNCDYDKNAAFEGSSGILFSSASSAKQTVSVSGLKTYCLHAFCKGVVSVQIHDNNGRFYDFDSLKWVETRSLSAQKSIRDEKWRNESFVVITDEDVSQITISFINDGSEEGAIDYIRLFEKDGTSSFSLIVSFTGAYTNSTLHVAQNDGVYDPAKQSYINQSFIYGGGGNNGTFMFSELLEAIRPFGVHASLEILTAN